MNKTLAIVLLSVAPVWADAPKPAPTGFYDGQDAEPNPDKRKRPHAEDGAIRPGAARAEIRNTSGQVIGQATFKQTVEGVEIRVDVRGLEPGEHGIHVHEKGECRGPDFASAGGHFKTDGQAHGLSSQHPHWGDLPNLVVDRKRRGKYRTVSKSLQLLEGNGSLLRDGGTAIVIHATVDDQKTDPSGGSGARIACGVIR